VTVQVKKISTPEPDFHPITVSVTFGSQGDKANLDLLGDNLRASEIMSHYTHNSREWLVDLIDKIREGANSAT
jgi:RNA-binding protein YlmH